MAHPPFDDLFRSEYPRLVRALTLACGDREVAADVAQEAFVQALRHWRRVGAYDEPALWLRRVALNRLANHRRGRGRLQRFIGRQAPPPAPEAPDVAVSLDLLRAVAALPDQQRLAVALHYLGDLPVTETAAALRVTPSTVRSHLQGARQALRVTLGEPEPDGPTLQHAPAPSPTAGPEPGRNADA